MAIIFLNEYNDKELCDFCKAKGVAASRRNKVALSVLLTKYNAVDIPCTEPYREVVEPCKQMKIEEFEF